MGKTILTTGAANGLGKAAATLLSNQFIGQTQNSRKDLNQ